MSTTTAWPSMLAGIISESKRVVSAHTRHFLALSVLFLLPLSSLLISLPSLLLLPSSLHDPPSSSLLYFFHHHQPLSEYLPSLPPLSLLSLSLLFLLSLSAASSISRSTLHSFFSRPVKLLPSVASIRHSFLHLLLTLLFPILTLLLLLSPLYILSPYLPFAVLSLSLLLFLPLIPQVAIFERTWGLPTIHRTNHLLKGMRWTCLCIQLFFLVGFCLILWGFSLREIKGIDGWKEAVPVVAWTVLGTGLMVVMFLYWMVSGVVLYLYCKAVHGELEREIAEEFASEYVFLPFDEHKVPHIVSVVRQ